MANPGFTLFQSKLAQRLTLLFVAVALIPITLLALMTYIQFTDQFIEQNKGYLHNATKNIGMTLANKLQQYNDELLLTAMQVNNNKMFNGTFDDKHETVVNTYRTKSFEKISLHSLNTTDTDSSAKDKILKDGWLTTTDLKHLKKNHPLLRSSKSEQGTFNLFLIIAIDKNNLNKGLLIAELSQKILWNFEYTLPIGTNACVFNMGYQRLHCTDNSIDIENLSQQLSSSSQSPKYFEWKQDQEIVAAYHWTLFLDGMFSSPAWRIVLNKSKSDIFSPLNQYKSTYPFVIVVSLLLITILSSRQIRKYLVPLELLKNGTREIAKGKFTTKIKLDSNDEFEQLASAFNHMSYKIDRQFKSLEIMSEVDRAILTSLDSDYIIETVLNGIRDLIPHCEVNLLSIENQHNPTISKYAIKTTFFSKHKISISSDEQKILDAHSNYLLINPGTSIPDFLSGLENNDNNLLVIYQIHVKKELVAIIVLKHNADETNYETTYIRARELIDRIAVALTNASWEGKLYQQSNFDTLTQLPNRTLLQDRLDQATKRARRDGTQVAVLYLDIDRFKSINDSLGYKVGDSIIKEVANRLGKKAESADSFGRYGSDEFIFIMSDLSYSANTISYLSTFSEFILNEVRQPLSINNHEIRITGSIGISVYPADAKNIDELLNYSEIAMHHAKSQNAGSFHFYSKDINAKSFAQLLLENDLRRALERDEFELYYQPQFDTQTFSLVGAEALIRWHHPKLGFLHPGQFLNIANETGLMIEMGQWIINHSCQQIKHWIDNGVPIVKTSINLSSHQFRADNLVNIIQQATSGNNITGEHIDFEITEDTIMSEIDKATKIMHDLTALGFKISIDDFGTGYSTLNYLAKFPVHCLKIDQSFVHDMTHDENVKSIVSAIIALGHSLNLSVVAEGIETEKQLSFLQQKRCDVVQGFLISKPLSTEEYSQYLIKHHRQTLKHAN